MLRRMVDQVKKSGANVVVCQKGIDDVAQHYLAKEGIFAVRRSRSPTCRSSRRPPGRRSSRRSRSSPPTTSATAGWSRSGRSGTTP